MKLRMRIRKMVFETFNQKKKLISKKKADKSIK